ncbi:high-affinity nickel-transporter [Salinisphaera hydrothermalis C41B8]|uniref:Nickel/cobalt efflux system n=1 Tax=Salinisphaera hydrothermalis (strain C41B8) TaxID=1304275 RepID=A0A084IRH2_SALHC|nr:high-affinity nickel-transporter [Salinisphaera hydrothermalis C41B8]
MSGLKHELDAGRRGASVRGVVVAVALLHLAGFAVLALAATQGVLLFGLAGLAYLFGLRHAFDIDHIAAIDNVTRKLVRDGRRATSVGFAFSLGHSTVVFLLCLLTALFARQVNAHMGDIAGLGGVIGTIVSATFLGLIGVLNLQVLRGLWRQRRMPASDRDATVEALLARRGVMSRWIGRGYRWVDAGWKMYPVGVAFGLGFDTATEVALLGLSATAAQNTLWSPWMIMALPLLFAAGMTLMDSANGYFMQRAYGWGQAGAGRRLGFNIAVTAFSVTVALLVSLLEWGELIVDQWAPGGWLARSLALLPSGLMGAAVVLVFLLAWALWYRRHRRAPSVMPTG